jgi:hypothetical protein
MAQFGYTPDRAEATKDQLDMDLCGIENRVRHIVGVVSHHGTLTVRAEVALDEIRGVVSDLQDLVDQRTDTAVAA